MKVILSSWSVFPFHGYLGINKYVYSLAKNLKLLDVDVEIVTSLPWKKKQKTYEGIKYTFLSPKCFGKKLMKPWQHLFNINLARYLRKQKFDILHSFTDTSYIYLHFRRRRLVVVQPFGLEPFTAPSFINPRGLKKLYLDFLSRHSWKYCLTHADAVAAHGEFQIPQLENFGIPREKLFVLPVGIDLSYIKERIRQPKFSRIDLGLGYEDFILISVNRFHPDRGILYLIEAFKLIREGIKSAKLIIIGEASNALENKIYKETFNQLKKYELQQDVIYLKNVPEDDLYNFYNLADVYISPTLLDDFLMSIQEAEACGLPIISTGQEFLVKHGVNGYIVPKMNARALAEAVITLYNNNEYKTMGLRSKEIIKKYDFSMVARKAIDKYEELLQSEHD